MKKNDIVGELWRVTDAIAAARDTLERRSDAGLFEAGVYELKYLQSKQAWLLAAARREGCTRRVRLAR